MIRLLASLNCTPCAFSHSFSSKGLNRATLPSHFELLRVFAANIFSILFSLFKANCFHIDLNFCIDFSHYSVKYIHFVCILGARIVVKDDL